jgi:D-amino peptidase
MKIYISADIEGITGIVNWDEVTRCKPDYPPFQAEMMNEVRAACEGANNRGAKEIWIKDAHGTARNLSFDGLPNNTTLIRAFNGHPYTMMQEIDETFDAVLMIGYHSYASSGGNPLSHTLETDFVYIKINGEYASEFMINGYTAAMMNVPVVFVSGDEGLCGHVKSINKNIITVSVGKGVGSSVISIHPEVVFCNIKSGVEEALSKDFKKCKLNLPQNFLIELSYIDHAKAYKASFYPGMDKVSATTLVFKTNDYFEVLRMLAFVV